MKWLSGESSALFCEGAREEAPPGLKFPDTFIPLFWFPLDGIANVLFSKQRKWDKIPRTNNTRLTEVKFSSDVGQHIGQDYTTQFSLGGGNFCTSVCLHQWLFAVLLLVIAVLRPTFISALSSRPLIRGVLLGAQPACGT